MERIEINCLKNLKKKINLFKTSIKDNNFIIISDFDYTLSKKYFNGKKMYSTYCFLEKSSLINKKNKNFLKEIEKLNQEYIPIESNYNIDFEFKKEKIKEWFIKALDLYVSQKFSKDEYNCMIEKINKKELTFSFRDGIEIFFKRLIKYEIPIIIISGGLKKPIDLMLGKILNNYKQLKEENKIIILANSFTFNNEGIVNGYYMPVIYTFNKENIIKDEISKKYPKINKAFVMGDHLNDFNSIKGLNLNSNMIIGIGFINYINVLEKENLKEVIKKYKAIYDINIINGSFFSIIRLLDSIFNQND